MRLRLFALIVICGLTACSQEDAANDVGATLKSPGRYAGIGTFDAGRLWQQIAGASASQDPAAAGLADDEHIIVVLDSHTGEVRQCGDHSGVCIAMNPWSGNHAAIAAPAKLAKHAADLDSEAERSDGSTITKSAAAQTRPEKAGRADTNADKGSDGAPPR